jgi:hypothetical protein
VKKVTRKVFLILLALVLALSVGLVACGGAGEEEEEEEETYDLTITSTAGGLVAVPGEGVHTCEEGEVLNLVAEAAEGYQFVNWAGDVSTIADVNAAATTITMNGDYSITAEFAEAQMLPPTEEDLIEVMFAQDSKVRLHHGAPVDMTTNALAGVDDVLEKLEWFEWYRICDVPEEQLDEIQARGEANTSEPVYNLNNIYRLRIPMGLDIWAISKELETLPGIIFAQPVPKPVLLPQRPNYVPNQGYLRPASSTPAGIDADYAWTQPGGNGSGVTVCDLEYGWNYDHADITKAPRSQINPNPISASSLDHGTAVIGELVSDNNSWGTTGICYGASLKTCGTYYYQYYFPYFPSGFPNSPFGSYLSWNPAGAITYAIANLKPGDVILLELQWDYTLPVDATQEGVSSNAR